MKTNYLQLRRAMGIAMLVMLLNVAGTKNTFAQNQVATLQHEGNISMFFGQDALSAAHGAAEDGDTITLSSGNFNGCTISKSITIHGAGCDEDTIAGLVPTTITSEIALYNIINTAVPLTFEGLLCGNIRYGVSGSVCNNVIFKKCKVLKLCYDYHSYSVNNLQLIRCIIKDFYFTGQSATIVNSVVKITAYNQNAVNNINSIYNSILVCNDNIHLNNSEFYNSIIATGSGNNVTNTTFFNCINIQTGDTQLFEGQVNNTNMTVENYNNVFATFAGDVTFDNIYQLNSNIVNTFLGNDGTQVGIYGGMMPYNTRPTYMIIKTINVAGRTTGDDKLGVQIELNNAQ